MWWNRQTVLAAIVVIVALHGRENSALELDSVDDRYVGCRDAVLKKLDSGLLQEELAASPDFQKAWKANKDCNLTVPGGREEHGKALGAFVYGGKAFRNTFNRAVETMGGNRSFPFRSLHFLLTDAILLLQKKEEELCQTVYHLPPQQDPVRKGASLQKGATVKLGAFVMAQENFSQLKEDNNLDKRVLFNITSCFVLNLEEICKQELEVEMLLLPGAEYMVEKVLKDIVDIEGYSYTGIRLNHSGFSNSHNCYLDPRADKGSSIQVLGCMWMVYLTLAVLDLYN